MYLGSYIILKFINNILFYRECSLKDKEYVKERVVSLCRVLELFLKSEEYTQDLQNELNISNPNFLKVLQKRILDMEKTDHGIVIAGVKEKKMNCMHKA